MIRHHQSSLRHMVIVAPRNQNKISGGIVTTIPGIIVGIAVALSVDWFRKKFQTSRLKAVQVSYYRQNEMGVFRLIIKNDGSYKASKVEVYVDEVWEDGKKRDNFVPAPMWWMHQPQNAELRRDIFPNQKVFLDLLNLTEKWGDEFIKLAAPNLLGIKDMPVIKKGKTRIILRYYEENGQTDKFEISVDWSGNANIEKGLPVVSLKN